MAEPPLTVPAGGWTTDDLDTLPLSNQRYELTDGAVTVSHSPSSLHQAFAARLVVALGDLAPEPLAVTGAVEIRFARQLTRTPDVLVIHSDDPTRHWFAPAEVVATVEIESPGSHVEDRTTKPALYAQYGIAYLLAHRVGAPPGDCVRGEGNSYRPIGCRERLQASEPFPVDIELAQLLPRWAR